jgi:sterol O-acyltransferase
MSSTASFPIAYSQHGSTMKNDPGYTGNSLRAALNSVERPRSGSGASTPPSELGAKSRRYLLTANDDEIRSMLQARLDREAALQGGMKAVRLRDLVFTKRLSTFDRQNPLSAESPFHGFFTLFWLAIALMLLKVAAQNWKVYGSVLGKAEILHIMFDRDIIVLGITDCVMVASTIFGLGLQKVTSWGYLSWRRSGWIVQNIWQSFFLAAILAWTWYRDWPWTHTIFIVLHTLVFVMKQHSYAFYNGYCSYYNFHLLAVHALTLYQCRNCIAGDNFCKTNYENCIIWKTNRKSQDSLL